jgi:probable HAF family extracellular repeat protein
MDVSADGEVVVGYASAANTIAFRWTAGSGLTPLGTLPGADYSFAEGVSSDGATIVGSSGLQAYRWTEASGMVSIGPGQAHDVSANGEIAVGWRSIEAFRWTESTGVELLGELPGGHFGSRARAISPDGSVIVGWSYGPSGTEAIRWSASEGMQGLGDLPGGEFLSQAWDASALGQVIVGAGSSDVAPNEAFVWTPQQGMRALAEILSTDYGIDTAGWVLRDAYAVSADGRTVVGWGQNPEGLYEAWLVVLAPACSDGFDNDGDGLVDHPEDPGCPDPAASTENPACQDGLDNDGDGLVDFDGGASAGAPVVSLDPECLGQPWRNRELPGACGLGFEILGLLFLHPKLRRRRRSPS